MAAPLSELDPRSRATFGWRNRFLSMMPDRERALLLPHLQHVPLRLNAVLLADGDKYSHVYFPSAGMLSVVIDMSDGRSAETATIGYEGAIGLVSGLCDIETAGRTVVQLPGDALRVSASHFRSVASQSNAVQELIVKFENLLLSEIKQAVACNALHGLQARLCTWLLRCHDICRGEAILLTQEFLAQMLGVRRTTVTLVAQQLQSSGIIHYTRGRIRVIDRQMLQHQACECYEAMRERKERLLEGASQP